MKAEEKAEQFLRKSLKLYGKKIAIPSNQVFCITELAKQSDPQNHIIKFKIQYGFLSSGSVCLDFTLDTSKGKPHATITDFIVHTQPADKSLIVANYSSQKPAGLSELGVSVKFGLDTNTVEYKGYEKIDQNPNALQMIDLALDDLDKALILGECMLMGSDYIPCCDTVPYPEKEDENGHKK